MVHRLPALIVFFGILVAPAVAHASSGSKPVAKDAHAKPPAKAEHGKPAATDAHATPAPKDAHATTAPAVKATKDSKHEAMAASKDVARTETDLRALEDRIQQRLVETVRAQKPAPREAARPHSGAAAPAGHASKGGTHETAAAPRVRLVWRTQLTWPSELTSDGARVSLAWGD